MQRRAAAVYFVLFLVLGGGAYGYMQVGMSQPEVDLDGPTLSEGEELTVQGRTYTVTGISAESGEDGSVEYTGELTWFNESARSTATLENGSTTPFRDGTYAVRIAAGPDPATFRLVEQFNVSALLAEDPEVENELLTREDRAFVRYRNGTTQPLSAYLPAPDTASFGTGDRFEYQAEGVTATVRTVGQSEVTVSWPSPANETVEFGQAENVTLNGQAYFGYFPSEDSVQVLPRDEFYGAYASAMSDIDYYQTRMNGMWGVVIISLLASIVLIAAAYLPNK